MTDFSKEKYVYISSCAEKGGIYLFKFKDGILSLEDRTEVSRPMYSEICGGRLFVVFDPRSTDDGEGKAVSFDILPDGRLSSPSEEKPTRGKCPCHLSVLDGNIYIANYLSGSVVSSDGGIDVHTGRGANTQRQDAPHPHFIFPSPDGKYLLSCDLGLDSVYTYDFGLNALRTAKTGEGQGPRHLAYSKDGRYVYCANELGSTVSVFSYDDGRLSLLSTQTTVADGGIINYPAAIKEKDGYIFISNRGENTIAVFKAEGEKLTPAGRYPSLGDYPWDIGFIEGYAICVNKNSDNITVFSLKDGALTFKSSIDGIKAPICVTVKE